jgi:hypothetical protein
VSLITIAIFSLLFNKGEFLLISFLLLIAADAFLSARLNLPFTGYNVKAAASQIQEKVDSLILASNQDTLPLKQTCDTCSNIPALWRNVNIFNPKSAIGISNA